MLAIILICLVIIPVLSALEFFKKHDAVNVFNEAYHLLALLMVFVQIIFGLFFLIPAGFEASAVLTMLIMELLMYGLTCLLLFQYANLARKQADDLEEETKNSEHQLEHISKIVQGAADNFESISKLTNKVDNIQRLIRQWLLLLNNISRAD